MPEPFLPRRPLPPGLVHPVRVDATGVAGPTRAQSRSRRWRRVGNNAYVPVRPDAPPEQRILDATAHLPPTGALTGWAALRLHEAAYFDGLRAAVELRPVPLITGTGDGRRAAPGITLSYEQLPPDDVTLVRGIRVATSARALFDEMRALSLRDGVVAADMAVAAHVVRLDEMRCYVAARTGWRRAGRAGAALAHARAGVRSPRESLLRLIWTQDAGLPTPGVNTMLFDRHGRFIGCADLFDETAGLVVEYDGVEHLGDRRRARDAARDEDCRAVGLEYTRVVSSDLRDPALVARRLVAARGRALFLPPERRAWTTQWPPGWTPWF